MAAPAEIYNSDVPIVRELFSHPWVEATEEFYRIDWGCLIEQHVWCLPYSSDRHTMTLEAHCDGGPLWVVQRDERDDPVKAWKVDRTMWVIGFPEEE
jgi:hypothetical protein